MRLIYFIQLLSLMWAFWYGYQRYREPFELVAGALGIQLVYGVVIYSLYWYFDNLISVFDLLDVEKERWLPRFISWLSRHFHRGIQWRIDALYIVVSLTGGYFITLLFVLGGWLTQQGALQRVRVFNRMMS